MSDFSDIYKEYLILQYYNKPKASAEMALYTAEFENVFNFLNSFIDEFDVDKATGDRLDLIGKIVGVGRLVSGGVVHEFFGFFGAAGALAYGQGRYRGAGDSLVSGSTLNDGQYRIFIKAKIAKNTVHAVTVSSDFTGIQETINDLFVQKAHVVDNLDMTMTINIDDDVPTGDVDLIVAAGLLPNPQGVEFIITYIPVI